MLIFRKLQQNPWGERINRGLTIIRHQEVILHFQLLLKYNIPYELKPMENGDLKSPNKRDQDP